MKPFQQNLIDTWQFYKPSNFQQQFKQAQVFIIWHGHICSSLHNIINFVTDLIPQPIQNIVEIHSLAEECAKNCDRTVQQPHTITKPQ